MTRYSIHEDNMERLEKKLNRISKKCEKYCGSFTYNRVGEEFREVTDADGNVHIARFVIVEAEGIAKINDWQFVATLEHTDNGNIIRNATDDIEVPERYYHCKAVCEHCGTNRRRKNTYIVRNAVTGEFKQVGKSCIMDFTHGLSAEGIASYLSWFDELVQGEEPYDGSWGSRDYYETTLVLQFVAETIRHFGYVKSQDYGRSTARRAFGYYQARNSANLSTKTRAEYQHEMAEVDFNENNPEAMQMVHEALQWVEAQEESNNYLHNLKTVCTKEFIDSRDIGILASLFPAYDRELERQAVMEERALEPLQSSHVGNVGDRINFEVTLCSCLTSYVTEWGLSFVYKLKDTAGNVYVWKTNKFGFELDDVVSVKGTVVGHSEYKGVKQTVITRCKLTLKGSQAA